MTVDDFIKLGESKGLTIYYPKEKSDCYEIWFGNKAICGYREKNGPRGGNGKFDYAIEHCSSITNKDHYNGKTLYTIKEIDDYLNWYKIEYKNKNMNKLLNDIKEDFN